ETIGTATRLNMSFNAHVTAVSKRWFDRLPAGVRDGIERAASETWAFQKREQRKADDLMWAQWREAGIKVLDLSAEESKQWADAIGHQRPEWDQWKKRYGPDLYDRIRKSV